MKTFAFISFLVLATLPAPAQAQDLILHDSTYYTIDDGIMDQDEMMEEADTMYRLCELNAYQKKYFDCGCFAGAYLQQREKLGPIATQSDIYESVTNSATTSNSCANTERIAGEAYDDCLRFASQFRELARDNDEYCTCAANKMANDFAKTPRLSSGYITNIRTNAMEFCEDPKNRPKPKQSAASAKPGSKTLN